jgi:hypothetical protein
MQNAYNEVECPNCRGPPIPKALFRHLGTHDRDVILTDGNLADAPQDMQPFPPFQETGMYGPVSLGVHGNAHPRRPPDPVGASIRSESETSRASDASHDLARHISTFFSTFEIAEWNMSWSMDPIEEYFRQKHEAEIQRDRSQLDTYHGDIFEVAHLKTISKTKLPDGKLSLLVDLGSRINIMGEITEREFALEAERHGYQATYEQRKHRLNVNGVGSGSAPCDEEASIPIAIKFEDQPATQEIYKANVATGSGENLPAILGSQSMQDKDAVILLRKGKEMIVFPGPGGYKIEWSPGSKLLPMIPAPSGHLVIPCDKYAELNHNKSDNQEQLTFWTDHSHANE